MSSLKKKKALLMRGILNPDNMLLACFQLSGIERALRCIHICMYIHMYIFLKNC